MQSDQISVTSQHIRRDGVKCAASDATNRRSLAYRRILHGRRIELHQDLFDSPQHFCCRPASKRQQQQPRRICSRDNLPRNPMCQCGCLPVPAPAIINRGASPCITADRCCGFSDCRNSGISDVGRSDMKHTQDTPCDRWGQITVQRHPIARRRAGAASRMASFAREFLDRNASRRSDIACAAQSLCRLRFTG